jgi:hypothetical protein
VRCLKVVQLLMTIASLLMLVGVLQLPWSDYYIFSPRNCQRLRTSTLSGGSRCFVDLPHRAFYHP